MRKGRVYFGDSHAAPPCSASRKSGCNTTGKAGRMETLHTFIDLGASGIEAMAVALIVCTFIYSSIRFLLHASRHQANSYQKYKVSLGRSLSLGLEFLVAADVIRTVVVAPTITNIGILGAIVVTRTALSWSLIVETERRWPWQPATGQRSELKVQKEGLGDGTRSYASVG
jgi:uncharacterized membrane protein